MPQVRNGTWLAREHVCHLGWRFSDLQKEKLSARMLLSCTETLHICFQYGETHIFPCMCMHTNVKWKCACFCEIRTDEKNYDYHNSGTCYFVFYCLNVIQKSMIIYTIFHENILDHWHALLCWANWWSAKCCLHFTHEWLCWPGRSPHSCAATQWSSHCLHWSFTAICENGIYPGISCFINFKSLMPAFQYLKEARIFYGF